MTPDLNFKTANNACLSLRIIAERIRTGEAQVLAAVEKPNGVLEIKIAWAGPDPGAERKRA